MAAQGENQGYQLPIAPPPPPQPKLKKEKPEAVYGMLNMSKLPNPPVFLPTGVQNLTTGQAVAGAVPEPEPSMSMNVPSKSNYNVTPNGGKRKSRKQKRRTVKRNTRRNSRR
jgi:hypothetical protein